MNREMSSAEFKATRESIGLTSKQLAHVFHVRPSNISRMEAGIIPIPNARAQQLKQLVDKFEHTVIHYEQSTGSVLTVPSKDRNPEDIPSARWKRLAALQAARLTGKRISYEKRQSSVPH